MGHVRLKRAGFILILFLLLTAPVLTSGAVKTGNAKKLAVMNIDEATYNRAVKDARAYPSMSLAAGVIPHHLVAGPMIAGFFKAVAEGGETYDTVVMVGPNHSGDMGDVIFSLKNWDFAGGVVCDTEIIKQIADIKLNKSTVVENDARMESDHALSAFIPYVNDYIPGAKVAPVLLSRNLNYGDAIRFAEKLADIILQSDKKILLLCSIDFSHFLNPREIQWYDSITLTAVRQFNYPLIHSFSNNYLDSPASLIVFLKYLEALEIEPRVLDQADASRFLGAGLVETTSYFIFTGV